MNSLFPDTILVDLTNQGKVRVILIQVDCNRVKFMCKSTSLL